MRAMNKVMKGSCNANHTLRTTVHIVNTIVPLVWVYMTHFGRIMTKSVQLGFNPTGEDGTPTSYGNPTHGLLYLHIYINIVGHAPPYDQKLKSHPRVCWYNSGIKEVFKRRSSHYYTWQCGPILFLIYIDDLYRCIKHSTTYHFADDTNYWISAKTIKLCNPK